MKFDAKSVDQLVITLTAMVVDLPGVFLNV
jgi:hypothetical protein